LVLKPQISLYSSVLYGGFVMYALFTEVAVAI